MHALGPYIWKVERRAHLYMEGPDACTGYLYMEFEWRAHLLRRARRQRRVGAREAREVLPETKAELEEAGTRE